MIANIFGPDLGIVVVIIILVVLFGSQLPKIARNVGMAGPGVPQGPARGRRGRRAGTGRQGRRQRPRPLRFRAARPHRRLGPAATSGAASRASEEKVTLTRSELDALLKAREEQARRETAGTAN